jgi:NAD(P)-dependent dehydrogenase (short-subunit alcohol dehydrogenase family)
VNSTTEPSSTKTVVITGASSGIGRAAAEELAKRGATVVPVGRDAGRTASLARKIGAEPISADFSSLSAVRGLADELLSRYERIDVLVNNAGLVSGRRKITTDGLELTMAVNHFAPFLLTNLLLDRLRDSAPARVVTTASDAHRGGLIDVSDLSGERRWSAWSAYSNSKLANILFTRALARRLEGSGVTANCLHPGVIRTGLGRGAPLPVRLGWRVASVFFGSPRKGARTIVHLAEAREGGEVSGGYFADSRRATPSVQAQDDELAEDLWEASERFTGLARTGGDR